MIIFAFRFFRSVIWRFWKYKFIIWLFKFRIYKFNNILTLFFGYVFMYFYQLKKFFRTKSIDLILNLIQIFSQFFGYYWIDRISKKITNLTRNCIVNTCCNNIKNIFVIWPTQKINKNLIKVLFIKIWVNFFLGKSTSSRFFDFSFGNSMRNINNSFSFIKKIFLIKQLYF